MTTQMSNYFRYGNAECVVLDVTAEPFDPASLGFETFGARSDCWRGYVATFGLSKLHLVLDTLRIDTPPGADPREPTGPAINGVTPWGNSLQRPNFNNHYEGINYDLDFTGGIVIGDQPMWTRVWQLGSLQTWDCGIVFELVFENGRLIREIDHSTHMRRFRQERDSNSQWEVEDYRAFGQRVIASLNQKYRYY